MLKKLVVFAAAIALGASVYGQKVTFRELIDDPTPPRAIVYKQVDGKDLTLFQFPGLDSTTPRPAMVWIHGGGWVGGTAESMFPTCRYFVGRGMVAFSINYRTLSPEAGKITDYIADCRDAIAYIRLHAAELGVDAKRVVVAGDSAGGHLTACMAMVNAPSLMPGQAALSRPDVMLVYNPVLNLTEGSWMKVVIGGAALAKKPASAATRPSEADQALAMAVSPFYQVRAGLPPMLLMHGLKDMVVRDGTVRAFAAAVADAGNRVELVLLPDDRHAFIIPNYKTPEAQTVAAMRRTDEYLAKLGYLVGLPTLEVSNPAA